MEVLKPFQVWTYRWLPILLPLLKNVNSKESRFSSFWLQVFYEELGMIFNVYRLSLFVKNEPELDTWIDYLGQKPQVIHSKRLTFVNLKAFDLLEV